MDVMSRANLLSESQGKDPTPDKIGTWTHGRSPTGCTFDGRGGSNRIAVSAVEPQRTAPDAADSQRLASQVQEGMLQEIDPDLLRQSEAFEAHEHAGVL